MIKNVRLSSTGNLSSLDDSKPQTIEALLETMVEHNKFIF